MRITAKLSVTMLALAYLSASPAKAQETQLPAQAEPSHHHHGDIRPVEAQYPHMGRAQANAQGKLVTLEELQNMASELNPTMRQAEAQIRAAKARYRQAGLYPNPTVGYAGNEIRGGSFRGGEQGFFVQQTWVTAGKLGLNRDVFAKEAKLAEIEALEQKGRVESAVKLAYLRVLGAQELLEVRRDLAKIAADAAETQKRLVNTGQSDETEVLEAEVEAQRMRLAARMQENTLHEEWRSLAAVVGQQEMPVAVVSGNLEKDWPELNEEEAVAAIATDSPALRIAEGEILKERAVLASARREAIPDVAVRAGLEYNNEIIGGVPHATGWQTNAGLSLQIPIFNRNQGNVAAAHADIERAEQEKKRIALTLRERAAAIVDQYANARLMAGEYRDEILPRAKKSYGLMVEKYGLTLASYPRVLETQKKLYELQMEYVMALEGVWTSGIALQGYLLTDGLEAPARPGEMDRPVRETNVPMPERSLSPGSMQP